MTTRAYRAEFFTAADYAVRDLHSALEYFFNIMHDYDSIRRKGYVQLAKSQARAALKKAKPTAARALADTLS